MTETPAETECPSGVVAPTDAPFAEAPTDTRVPGALMERLAPFGPA